MLTMLLAAVLQISDMARIVDLEEPAISADSSRIAVISIAQSPTADVNNLILVDPRSGRMQTLVRGRDVAVPRWSPQGTSLAYLARPSEAAVRQLFVRTEHGRAR